MTTDQKLTHFRKKSGFSQEKLAEQLEVSRQTVSRWETGVCIPSSENLAKLSELFQVPMDIWFKTDWTPSETAVPAVKVVELPIEVLVPLEPPTSRPKRRPLFLLAALILGVFFLVGVLFFRKWRAETETMYNIQEEQRVIDELLINESLGLIDPSETESE